MRNIHFWHCNPYEDQEVAAFSAKTVFGQTGTCRSLKDIMDCQRLKFTNKHFDQATIHSSFIPTLLIDWSNTIGASDELCRQWVLFRHTKDPDRIQNIPSFAATNIILHCGEENQATTRVAFPPNYSTSYHRLQHHQYSYGKFSERLKSKGT